jgi:endogenous inhibitor of DNA gyrase (YacG/DUF329 family)
MARTKATREGATVLPLYRPRKCAICGKPTVREFHPFCSRRCADLDLGNWLSGSYAIPAVEAEPEGQEDSGHDEE